MKMDPENLSVAEILKAIGKSLELMRIEAQLPDADVVQRGGIKETTWKHLKSGRNVTTANLVKALKGLGRLAILDALVNHEIPPSPMDLVRKSSTRLKRRIRKKKREVSAEPFAWGDEE